MKLDTVQNLAEAFVCSTEFNLATLEEALLLKKSSKTRLQRLKSICLDSLKVCAGPLLNGSPIRWNVGPQKAFPRVAALLAHDSSPAALERAFELYVLKVQGTGQPKAEELQPA